MAQYKIKQIEEFDISSPSMGNILQYDGTSWVNIPNVGFGGIYHGSGIVPSSTIVTLTDNITFKSPTNLGSSFFHFYDNNSNPILRVRGNGTIRMNENGNVLNSSFVARGSSHSGVDVFKTGMVGVNNIPRVAIGLDDGTGPSATLHVIQHPNKYGVTGSVVRFEGLKRNGDKAPRGSVSWFTHQVVVGDVLVASDDNGNLEWGDISNLIGGTAVTIGGVGSGSDNHIMRWDGTSDAQDSGVILDDLDNINGVNDMTINNDLVVHGNFVVNGTSSTINTENLLVEDPIILLAGNQVGSPTLDSGFFINRGSSPTQSLLWDESLDQFAFITTSESHEVQGNVTITGYSNLRIGGFQLTDGTQATDYILVTDTNGVGSWTAASSLGLGDGIYSGSGTVPTTTISTLTDTLTFGSNVLDLNESNIGVGVGTVSSASYSLIVGGDTKIDGTFYAISKSFDIKHPSDPSKRLRYGSLEGPEHGVYFRGKLEKEDEIILPSYWKDLVDESTITVQLTPFGKKQRLYVGDVSSTKIKVLGGRSINCYFNVYGERKDIGKITIEY